ncbi:hypothetical protein, partial [Pseudomonas aeruginosa]|uniref:hypothetical protein n=1 Tax=Pseudomonas aeruginosa TaxID=287 RepID=UPI001968F4CA
LRRNILLKRGCSSLGRKYPQLFHRIYISLVLVNGAVLAGTICVLAGVNNGGGEYREYIWPVMITFGIGVALSLHNYFKPIVHRKTREIYLSN